MRSALRPLFCAGVQGSLENLLREPMAKLLRARNPHGLTVRCGSCARCARPSARSLKVFQTALGVRAGLVLTAKAVKLDRYSRK